MRGRVAVAPNEFGALQSSTEFQDNIKRRTAAPPGPNGDDAPMPSQPNVMPRMTTSFRVMIATGFIAFSGSAVAQKSLDRNYVSDGGRRAELLDAEIAEFPEGKPISLRRHVG